MKNGAKHLQISGDYMDGEKRQVGNEINGVRITGSENTLNVLNILLFY